jgi:hypothetical protein
MTTMLGLTRPVLTSEPCPQAKPRVSREASKQKKGVIYIHEHQSKSVVKIGRTTGDPNKRLRHYSNIYSLKGFRLAHQIPVSKNLEIIERKIHQALRQKGYHLSMGNGAREIFACSLEKAIAAAEYEINKLNTQLSNTKNQVDTGPKVSPPLISTKEHKTSADNFSLHRNLDRKNTLNNTTIKRENDLTYEGVKNCVLGYGGFVLAFWLLKLCLG